MAINSNVCSHLFTFALMMTAAFSRNIGKLFSELKLVPDSLLFKVIQKLFPHMQYPYTPLTMIQQCIKGWHFICRWFCSCPISYYQAKEGAAHEFNILSFMQNLWRWLSGVQCTNACRWSSKYTVPTSLTNEKKPRVTLVHFIYQSVYQVALGHCYWSLHIERNF